MDFPGAYDRNNKMIDSRLTAIFNRCQFCFSPNLRKNRYYFFYYALEIHGFLIR